MSELRQASAAFAFETNGPGLTEITGQVTDWLAVTGSAEGLLTLFCRHTSASLLITENASPAVLRDMVDWLARLAPQSERYEHDSEGPDDMPAHLKAGLTGVSLAIPVRDGRMVLGTWQGVFLAEHRARPHRREVAAHILGA